MRWLLIAGCVGLTACEGCDFSFGPVGVIVAVTPEDAEGTLELCVEGSCREVPLPHVGGDGAAPNQVRFDVGWHGYLVCKHPELVATVRTAECERQVVRARQRPPRTEGRVTRGPVHLQVPATCDDEPS